MSNAIYKKLLEIQSNLSVPKDQYNSFGKFKYRSAETILRALTPLAKEQGCFVILSDKLVENQRGVYVEATARLVDIESGESIDSRAYAREPEHKTGMDSSQVTGASSSYARKYALCGLFAIDDGIDNDKFDNRVEQNFSKVNLATIRAKAQGCTTLEALAKLWDSLSVNGVMPEATKEYLKPIFAERREEIQKSFNKSRAQEVYEFMAGLES